MRFILIVLMATILSSCKDDMAGNLRGGTVITIKGDTITFYGGTLTNSQFGSRSIKGVLIDDKGD